MVSNMLKPLLALAARPAEELYGLKNDPHEVVNLAAMREIIERYPADWLKGPEFAAP